LFIDSLALEHVLTLDLLDVVLRVFPSVHIHTAVDEETMELLAYEGQADEAVRVVDSARRTIHAAFEGDTIRFGPRRPGAEDDDDGGEFPILHLLSDLASVDVLLVDDRTLAGQGVATDADGRQVAVVTTLDVIEDLRRRELITVKDWRRHRFVLRQCGAMLVPLDAEEVVAGATRSGETESAELRAVREGLALARLTGLPHFPRDIRWFISICIGITHGIQRTFVELPRDRAEGVASYLYRVLPDPGDWLGFWDGAAGLDWVKGVDRVLHQGLVAALDIDDPLAREAYRAWVEERVLDPMRTLGPERYRALVQLLREFLLEIRSDHVDGG
jgi:hypothetical protein